LEVRVQFVDTAIKIAAVVVRRKSFDNDHCEVVQPSSPDSVRCVRHVTGKSA
jgi:hypothetical protein